MNNTFLYLGINATSEGVLFSSGDDQRKCRLKMKNINHFVKQMHGATLCTFVLITNSDP